MRSLYDDWRAPGLSVCLHEQAGGYAFNKESMHGLADLARAAGARIETGIEVTGFASDTRGRGDHGAHQRRGHRRRAGGRRRRPLGRLAVVDARPPRSPRRASARRPRRHRPADVDLLVPPGGRGRLRPVDLRHQRRRLVAGAPRRLRRAAARRRRDADHRRVLGRLLQARPRQRPGRRPAAHRRPRLRRRPLPDRHRRHRLPRTCGRPRSRTASSASRARGPSTARSARAASAPSPSTTSRCSTTCAPTCSWPRTPTTATR